MNTSTFNLTNAQSIQHCKYLQYDVRELLVHGYIREFEPQLQLFPSYMIPIGVYQICSKYFPNLNGTEEEYLELGINVGGCYSMNLNTKYECLQWIRSFLSNRSENVLDVHAIIDRVIATNVVSKLIEFLNEWKAHKLQFESAWSLTNILSGSHSHVQYVLSQKIQSIKNENQNENETGNKKKYEIIEFRNNNNIIAMFVQLIINSPSVDVQEQAIWALGNIAGF